LYWIFNVTGYASPFVCAIGSIGLKIGQDFSLRAYNENGSQATFF
jgi:hypothetical protein